ncbi:MAG: SDR family oxidoreductase [Rhodospirillales bacterium]|jgi:NAD(P)-dependent dehydrogenase (short-subunit alcohol dehydrogenase family)|nr:SDR family oxidoreductase [Rhodospirillales bacterium]MDP6884320.1 SDR family oxidoreductase [Rhodospirillales bacterium]
MLLSSRVALVTGGAGRLGRVIAATLQREGASVAVVDKDSQAAKAVTGELGGGDRPAITAIGGDVSDTGEVARVVGEATAQLGQVDVLVNCAGIVPSRPVVEVEVEEWDRVFAVNLRGTMLMCQAMAREWIARDVKGAIVNISSGAGRSARAGGAHYSGSKAALNMLTEVLAIELGPHAIRVNAVAPGLILDDVVTEESEARHPYINLMLRGTPLGRTGAPADIAEAVAFLASERSSWTTGSIFDITGGSHCGRTHMPTTEDLS